MVFNIIISILIIILPMSIHTTNNVMYASGSCVNLLYGACVLYFVLIFICSLLNVRKIMNRKFIPLVALIALIFIMFVVRKINPGLLIIPAVLSYVDLIMFFTIENPDLKMIYELNRNKKLLESMSEEKSNFLFTVSQETKRPINNILEVKKILETEQDIKEIETGLKVIENNARSLKSTIDNVLDVSNINSSKLIVHTETYNIYSLLTLCIKNVEQKLNNNVKLRTNISQNIPKELYGDAVKLKQVIISVLVNAAKYTKEGFIEVRANEIVKYDVCRLIIEVEDSGCGLTIEKLNELLKSSSSLEDTDLLKLDGLDVDLKLAFKIVNKLGGFINIKSEEEKGSTFTIVIDQKIKPETDTYYSKYLFNKKKVIVASDKSEVLKDLNAFSSKYDIELLASMFGNDIVQRVKNGEAFDLVILDEDMKPDSALAVLNNLRKVKKNYNMHTIIMLDESKSSIAKHYLDDGFDNYIIKNNLEEDYDKIIKKYV